MVEQAQHFENRFQRLGQRVLKSLGRQKWLDRPSYRFEHVLSFGYNALGGARNRVTDVLNGVWLGHPVHPPLASLASGAIGTTVALDVISVLPYRQHHEHVDASRFATRALSVGILANIGSAVTGVTDWQHTHEEDRRIGLVHGALNLVATALYALSWRERHRGRHLRGIAVTALGYAITAGSSYLGGALVFGSGIGIDQSGERLRAPEWTPVLPATSLADGQLQRVEIDGVGVVLCRDGEAVSALSEYCPHLAAPMVDGWLDRGKLICPWHGSQFVLETGAVARGPAATPLPCYQTRIRDGVIELRDETCKPAGAGRGVAK